MSDPAASVTTCTRCAEPLTVKAIKRGARFCSYACFQADRAAGIEMTDNTCGHCGKVFRVSVEHLAQGRWKFCGKDCKDAGSRKHPARDCLICGASFFPRAESIAKGMGLYCSKTCGGGARQNRESLTCARCGRAFELRKSKVAIGRGVYCSRACSGPKQQKDCEICGKPFSVTDSELLRGWGRFCGLKCRSIERFGRERVWLARECIVCGTGFQATESKVEDGSGKYCSVACRGINRRNRINLTCAIYGDEFVKPMSLAGAKFCGKACMSEWQRTDTGWQEHTRTMRQDMLELREPTRCEVVLYELMDDIFGEQWERQWPVGFWTVDAAVPDLKLVVQADGDYWHGFHEADRSHAKVSSNLGNDKRCGAWCESHGWHVLRLWEHDLMDNPEGCAERIMTAFELTLDGVTSDQ